MSSTFSGYYVAKSGIQAARASLQITGQNMTNVNTIGYTRQRVDSSTVGPTGSNMRYASSEIGIGGGVNCDSVSQIRDPYLDIRYRAEHALTGKTGTESDILGDLENIFDESKKDGITTQFTDFLKQLNSLASSSSSQEDSVKSSARLLAQAFNNASQQLSKIRSTVTSEFQTDSILKANQLVQTIAHLNEEIKSADISGTPALELMDQRNTAIDELSQYANIEVSSKTVPIGSNRTVSEMQINLVSGSKKFNLVSNNQYSTFGTTTDADGTINLTLKDSTGANVTDGTNAISNKDITQGSFSAYLSMLNESGEYDSAGGTERGIGYYQKVLDKLAGYFADTMNAANSTNTAGDNKPLFTTTDGTTTTGITAANITLSNSWYKATSNYLTSTKQTSSSGDATSSKDNIMLMVSKLSENKTFTTNTNNVGGTTLLTTSIESFVSDVSVSILALQRADVNRQDTTYNSTLNEIDTKRAATSSVDVNEEGINLIMYNQALTASSRFMTTLDEAMDTIINNMGIVGR
jgi:flagellar hook-associated protein 1 FlgK